MFAKLSSKSRFQMSTEETTDTPLRPRKFIHNFDTADSVLSDASVEQFQKDADNIRREHYLPDLDTLMNMIVPRVRSELENLQLLHIEMQAIKNSLNLHADHSKSLKKKISAIVQDVRIINLKLELVNKLRRKREKTKKKYLDRHFCRRYRNVHVHKTPSRPVAGESIFSLNDIAKDKDDDIKTTEKKMFLLNMLVSKKSKISMHLNRHKLYFGELQKILKAQKRNKSMTD